MTEVLLLIFIVLNLLCFVGLTKHAPTTKEVFDLKGVPILGLLLALVIIPSITLYLFIKLLMWKPFGE